MERGEVGSVQHQSAQPGQEDEGVAGGDTIKMPCHIRKFLQRMSQESLANTTQLALSETYLFQLLPKSEVGEVILLFILKYSF